MQQIWDYGGCTWGYRHVPYKALSLFSFKIENTRTYIQKFNVFGLLGKLYGDTYYTFLESPFMGNRQHLPRR